MDVVNLPDCLITSGAIQGTEPLMAFKLSSNDAVHNPKEQSGYLCKRW